MEGTSGGGRAASPIDDKHFVWQELATLYRKVNRGELASFDTRTLIAAIVIADAARYEALIRTAADRVLGPSERHESKLDRLHRTCKMLGLELPAESAVSGSLSDSEWIRGLFALRNKLLHPDEPRQRDAQALIRLMHAGLSHDFETLDDDFLEESAVRWTSMGALFYRIAVASEREDANIG